MVEPTRDHLHRWKFGGDEVATFRCDNSGDSKKLDARINSKDWKLSVNFEYTPREKTYHNCLAQIGFTTLCNKVKVLMLKANLPIKLDVFYSLDHLTMHKNGLISVAWVEWII